MSIFFGILTIVFLGLFLAMFLKSQRLQKAVAERDSQIDAVKQESAAVVQHYESEALRINNEAQAEVERTRQHYESETAGVREHAQTAISDAQKLAEKQCEELKEEAERIHRHYEAEARGAQEAAERLVAKTLRELEPLRKFASLRDAETEVRRAVAEAMTEVNALREEARTLLEQSHAAGVEERSKASQRAKDLRERAEALLSQATLDAGRIVEEATKRAEQIGGDAYVALRDKQTLEQAVPALWNVVEGYGDRYVVPTRSLLDDLAADFGHTEAGEALRAAREQSRRMVEHRQAATCNYEESDRRERANRFIVDAFNGRVDAILSRSKHDNFGTLEQEIRDAFSLVNLNGLVFRDARILPAYLDARLAELKWAVIVQELKLRAREEQRRIQEQIREEEKVRREQERAIREAQDKEEAIKTALEKARLEAEHSTAQERAKFDAQITELKQRLAEAEAAKQREISMAQLTRAGNVYIISNVGSFGEEVFKIGMTRRREPMERIWELGDASVPFEFDVHAMIYSEDAPALERMLHDEFEDLRINKVNYRKEFFRLPVERIKSCVLAKGLTAAFTMVAEAREYRETKALEKMTPEQREKYHLHPTNGDDKGSE